MNQSSGFEKDISSIVMACLFILLAGIALWDTTTMLDSDSYVFPRAVAIAMIVFSLMLIFWKLIKPTKGPKETEAVASNTRRIMLVVIMLLSCLAMPWLGFLLPGIITFILLMLVSMYEKWTPARLIMYPTVAVVLVFGFYILFSNFLQVPLPVGTLFE